MLHLYIYTLLCVVFSCVIVTLRYCVSGQLWYLIVSIPDLCLPFLLLNVIHVLMLLEESVSVLAIGKNSDNKEILSLKLNANL